LYDKWLSTDHSVDLERCTMYNLEADTKKESELLLLLRFGAALRSLSEYGRQKILNLDHVTLSTGVTTVESAVDTFESHFDAKGISVGRDHSNCERQSTYTFDMPSGDVYNMQVLGAAERSGDNIVSLLTEAEYPVGQNGHSVKAQGNRYNLMSLVSDLTEHLPNLNFWDAIGFFQRNNGFQVEQHNTLDGQAVFHDVISYSEVGACRELADAFVLIRSVRELNDNALPYETGLKVGLEVRLPHRKLGRIDRMIQDRSDYSVGVR
jgi:hypothetical protein